MATHVILSRQRHAYPLACRHDCCYYTPRRTAINHDIKLSC